jgi:hypothetical protein
VVLKLLEAPYVPSKRTSSLNRERYAMAVWGKGQNFPLRESYPQWYPPHCSPPEVVPYRLRRTRTWWWTGPTPLTWGGGGGGRGSQPKKLQNLFCEKCCWADAPTSYFKEGGGVFSFIWDLITYVYCYLSGGLASPPSDVIVKYFLSRGEKPDKC